MNIPVNVKFPLPSTQARWGLGVSVKAELIMVGVKAFSCDWIKEEKKKRAICSHFSWVYISWWLNYLFCENYLNLVQSLSYVPKNSGTANYCFQLHIIMCRFCCPFCLKIMNCLVKISCRYRSYHEGRSILARKIIKSVNEELCFAVLLAVLGIRIEYIYSWWQTEACQRYSSCHQPQQI